VENEEGIFTLRLAGGTKSGDNALDPRELSIADGAITDQLAPEWGTAVRGARIEMLLQPSRFLFRPLELPSRAAEFLDGIVRAQIDRLTPWNASDAAYHWTPPCKLAGERIALTIVAAGRAAVTPLARAFSELGAASVEISTTMPGSERISVYSERAGGQADFGRIRLALVVGLAAAGLLAALSTIATTIIIDHYNEQGQQIQRRIAERRAIIRGSQSASGSSALELLERRKQTTAPNVLVIEALSALLPDHTYATEVRIEGDKLQVVGVTRDAPSLIQILEQSPHFSRAAFFAPTTRAPNDPGERFNIEAKIRPYFGGGT
jgi:general secretion pathway protein L